MRNKKRTKKDLEIIESVNKRFRDFNVKDERDNLFVWLCDYLLKSGKYEGFNYYKYNTLIIDGVEHKVIGYAGSHDPEKFDFLQIN